MLFARSSSARCLAGTKRSPSMCVRVLTIGGPPSTEVADSKKREIEKVLQGGAAQMSANSPRTMRSRSASNTSSLVMSALAPPPVLASLSNSSTSRPSFRANWAIPSGRLYAPEKSRSTLMEVLTRFCAVRVADAKDSGSDVGASAFGAASAVALDPPPAEMSCSSVGGAAVGVGAPIR